MSAIPTIGVLLTIIANPAEAFSTIGCKFKTSNPIIQYKKSTFLSAGLWSATQAGAARWNSHSISGEFQIWTSGSAVEIWVTETSYADPSILGAIEGSCASGGGPWVDNQVTFRPISCGWGNEPFTDDLAGVNFIY